jgi:hypothetical protein
MMVLGILGASHRRRRVSILIPILLITSLPLCRLFAQVSTSISSVSPNEAVSETPLTVRAELRQGETIERAYFVYRSFTETEWTQIEMDLIANTAFAKVPSIDLKPPHIEYYIVVVKRSGAMESYPLSESSDPLVRPPSKTLQIPIINKEKDLQAVFLSPEQNATFESDDVLISVSLLRADTVIVRRATQLILDGADISQHAVLSDDILVYVPDNQGIKLKPGRHKVTVVLYDRNGDLHRQVSTYFNVLSEGEQLEKPAHLFVYNGSVDVELRREKVNTRPKWYNRGGFRFNGSQGDWRFVANLFLTSDESSDRQPQNRYYTALESHWLLVGYGDSYPFFPTLILNGKRVRGLNSALRLGKFNIDLTIGKTVRDVEGALLKTIPVNNLEAEQRADSSAPYARIDSLFWGKYSYGTYARDLFAIRPSFGSGEKYQIGFTWLKSKDDINSIRFGTRPQENFVVGTDMISKFDQNRIELSGQLAFSAYNSDISSGNFTDAYINSVYKKDAAAIKDARDILKNVITVNDNLRPLSFRRLSTIAYDIGLALNYFDNSFKATYLYRGSDYNSFGQTFLRKDIAGINLTDRIKIAPSRVFITLGFESLRDNTSKSKAATSRFTTYNLAVSYDPSSAFPSTTLGFIHYKNVNDLMVPGVDSLTAAASAVNDQTNRFFLLVTKRFAYVASHVASLSLSTSHRSDYSPRNLDVKNVSGSIALNTQYAAPLQTALGYTFNYNNFPLNGGTRTTLRYSDLFVTGSYTFPEDKGVLSCTVSPTFGDFNRLTFDLSAQWNVTLLMNFILQYSYFSNSGLPNDDFWSLKYRYDY